MENFIEVVQSVILPIVTMVLGYFGWRANADKNKLKAELKSIEASNTSKEIENQSSWIDLYEKLANNQAKRMAEMEAEIQQLKKTIRNFEHVFKKVRNCINYDACPIRVELQKFESSTRRKRNGANTAGTGQRQRESNIRDPVADNAENDGDAEPDP